MALSESTAQSNNRAKVLLLSVATGEGHNSAAYAIADVLRERGIECDVKDSVMFKGKRAHRFVTNGYSGITKHAPALFGLAYALGAAYDNMRLPSPIYSYNRSFSDKVYKYIVENGYNCVICTHLFSMNTMTDIRKRFMPDIPCYGVLTDYTAIPFYKETKLDAYFVPDKRTEGMLVKKRIPQDKIKCIGIPVHPKYNARITKAEARERLGIAQDKKVIVVSTGGAGAGHVKHLCKRFYKAVDDGYEVCVFTGRNEKLKAKLDKIFGTDGRIKAIPFTSEIYLYLKAADVALTKPGGLSSTEVAVTNLPLVHLKAVPGCETCNRRYFLDNKMSVSAPNTAKAVKAALELIENKEKADEMIKHQRDTINPYTTDAIVDYVLNDMLTRDQSAKNPMAQAAATTDGKKSDNPLCIVTL